MTFELPAKTMKAEWLAKDFVYAVPGVDSLQTVGSVHDFGTVQNYGTSAPAGIKLG